MSEGCRRRSTVLHFTGYAEDIGGILSYIRAASFHNESGNILVVGERFKQSRSPRLPLLRVPAMCAESLYSPITQLKSLLLALCFLKLLREHPGLIFHGHSRAGLLVALWLSLWGQTRCLATVHANGSQRWFYRWAAMLMGTRLTFLCPSMKCYYGLMDTSWRGCHPGAPLGPVRPRARQRGTVLRLGGLGALVRWKRWHLVLEALALLPPELRAGIFFTHAGTALNQDASRDYETFLKAETVRRGLEANVSWRGRVGETEVFFNELDALLVCSENEPWGLAMLEALFAGVPALATASGGPVDVIRPGENGYLFTDGDAAALAELLAGLIRGEVPLPVLDPQPLQRYSTTAFGQRWGAVYHQIMSEQA